MSKRKHTQAEAGSGTVVGYVRVSTDGQEQGNGLDVQRQHIIAFSTAQGLHIDDWLEDVESGAKENRPGLDALRSGVADGRIGTVLVYRLDRLARDLLLAEQLHRELSARAKVVSVSEHFGEGFTGNLMRQIISAFAEYERAVIAARLKGGRKEAIRKNGTYSGGPGVYGYRPVGVKGKPGHGALVIVDSEVDAIRMVFATRASGHTLQEIADALNHKGYRTAKGAKFAPTQVSRILAREAFYKGSATLTSVEGTERVAHAPLLR